MTYPASPFDFDPMLGETPDLYTPTTRANERSTYGSGVNFAPVQRSNSLLGNDWLTETLARARFLAEQARKAEEERKRREEEERKRREEEERKRKEEEEQARKEQERLREMSEKARSEDPGKFGLTNNMLPEQLSDLQPYRRDPNESLVDPNNAQAARRLRAEQEFDQEHANGKIIPPFVKQEDYGSYRENWITNRTQRYVDVDNNEQSREAFDYKVFAYDPNISFLPDWIAQQDGKNKNVTLSEEDRFKIAQERVPGITREQFDKILKNRPGNLTAAQEAELQQYISDLRAADKPPAGPGGPASNFVSGLIRKIPGDNRLQYFAADMAGQLVRDAEVVLSDAVQNASGIPGFNPELMAKIGKQYGPDWFGKYADAALAGDDKFDQFFDDKVFRTDFDNKTSQEKLMMRASAYGSLAGFLTSGIGGFTAKQLTVGLVAKQYTKGFAANFAIDGTATWIMLEQAEELSGEKISTQEKLKALSLVAAGDAAAAGLPLAIRGAKSGGSKLFADLNEAPVLREVVKQAGITTGTFLAGKALGADDETAARWALLTTGTLITPKVFAAAADGKLGTVGAAIRRPLVTEVLSGAAGYGGATLFGADQDTSLQVGAAAAVTTAGFRLSDAAFKGKLPLWMSGPIKQGFGLSIQQVDDQGNEIPLANAYRAYQDRPENAAAIVGDTGTLSIVRAARWVNPEMSPEEFATFAQNLQAQATPEARRTFLREAKGQGTVNPQMPSATYSQPSTADSSVSNFLSPSEDAKLWAQYKQGSGSLKTNPLIQAALSVSPLMTEREFLDFARRFQTMGLDDRLKFMAAEKPKYANRTAPPPQVTPAQPVMRPGSAAGDFLDERQAAAAYQQDASRIPQFPPRPDGTPDPRTMGVASNPNQLGVEVVDSMGKPIDPQRLLTMVDENWMGKPTMTEPIIRYVDDVAWVTLPAAGPAFIAGLRGELPGVILERARTKVLNDPAIGPRTAGQAQVVEINNPWRKPPVASNETGRRLGAPKPTPPEQVATVPTPSSQYITYEGGQAVVNLPGTGRVVAGKVGDSEDAIISNVFVLGHRPSVPVVFYRGDRALVGLPNGQVITAGYVGESLPSLVQRAQRMSDNGITELTGLPTGRNIVYRGYAGQADELGEGSLVFTSQAEAEIYARSQAGVSGGKPVVEAIAVRPGSVRLPRGEAARTAMGGPLEVNNPAQVRVVAQAGIRVDSTATAMMGAVSRAQPQMAESVLRQDLGLPRSTADVLGRQQPMLRTSDVPPDLMDAARAANVQFADELPPTPPAARADLERVAYGPISAAQERAYAAAERQRNDIIARNARNPFQRPTPVPDGDLRLRAQEALRGDHGPISGSTNKDIFAAIRERVTNKDDAAAREAAQFEARFPEQPRPETTYTPPDGRMMGSGTGRVEPPQSPAEVAATTDNPVIAKAAADMPEPATPVAKPTPEEAKASPDARVEARRPLTAAESPTAADWEDGLDSADAQLGVGNKRNRLISRKTRYIGGQIADPSVRNSTPEAEAGQSAALMAGNANRTFPEDVGNYLEILKPFLGELKRQVALRAGTQLAAPVALGVGIAYDGEFSGWADEAMLAAGVSIFFGVSELYGRGKMRRPFFHKIQPLLVDGKPLYSDDVMKMISEDINYKMHFIIEQPEKWDLTPAQKKAVEDFQTFRTLVLQRTQEAERAAGLPITVTREGNRIHHAFTKESYEAQAAANKEVLSRPNPMVQIGTPTQLRKVALEMERELGDTWEEILAKNPLLRPPKLFEDTLLQELSQHQKIRSRAALVWGLQQKGVGKFLPDPSTFDPVTQKEAYDQATAMRAEWVKKQKWAQVPGITDLYVHPDAAEVIDRLFKPAYLDNSVLNTLDRVTSNIRTAMFSLDLSAWTMQGAMLAINSPGAFVKHGRDLFMGTFSEDFYRKWWQARSLWREAGKAGVNLGRELEGREIQRGFQVANRPVFGKVERSGFGRFLPMARAIMYDEMRAQDAFIEKFGKGVGKLPVAGEIIRLSDFVPAAVYIAYEKQKDGDISQQDFWVAASMLMFGGAGSYLFKNKRGNKYYNEMVAAIGEKETAEQFAKRKATRLGVEARAAKAVNRTGGVLNREQLGIGPEQAKIERTLIMRSPSLTRNSLTMLKLALTNPGAEGQYARAYLTRTLLFYTSILATAKELFTDDDESFDPTDPKSLLHPTNLGRLPAGPLGKFSPSNPNLAVLRMVFSQQPVDGQEGYDVSRLDPRKGEFWDDRVHAASNFAEARTADAFGPLSNMGIQAVADAAVGTEYYNQTPKSAEGDPLGLVSGSVAKFMPLPIQMLGETGILQQTNAGRVVGDALNLEPNENYNTWQERLGAAAATISGISSTPESIPEEMNRIRDEVVQQVVADNPAYAGMGDVQYKDLRGAEKEEVNRILQSNEQHSKLKTQLEEQDDEFVSPVDTYYKRVEAVNKSYEAEVVAAINLVRSNDMSKEQFKKKYQQLGIERRAKLEEIESSIGQEDAKRPGKKMTVMQFLEQNPNKFDQAVDSYYELYDTAIGKDGMLDFDLLETQQAGLLNSLEPNVRKYVEQRVQKYDGPGALSLVNEWKQARQIAQPYWDAPDMVFQQARQQLPFFAQFANKREFDNMLESIAKTMPGYTSEDILTVLARENQEVARYLDTVTGLRTMLRQKNPLLDTVLFEWYGVTPADRSRYALAAVYGEAQDPAYTEQIASGARSNSAYENFNYVNQLARSKQRPQYYSAYDFWRPYFSQR